MSLRDEGYVLDMLLAARRVIRFADGKSREEFIRDEVLQSALVRQIQIIGEAAWRVSDEFRAAQPQVPWPQIVGMRHRIVHEYTNVDLDLVWEVVAVHAPALVEMLEPIIPPEQSE